MPTESPAYLQQVRDQELARMYSINRSIVNQLSTILLTITPRVEPGDICLTPGYDFPDLFSTLRELFPDLENAYAVLDEKLPRPEGLAITGDEL